jgi:hypothetical protein
VDPISFTATRYRLDMELADAVGRVTLTDSYSGVAFADSEYRYSAYVEADGRIARLEGLYAPRKTEQDWRRGGRIISVEGVLGGPNAEPRVAVKHHLYFPEDSDFLEERIVLQNLGKTDVLLRGYRFGFRKRIERPRKYGGPGVDVEDYRLIAIPFRLQPDGKKHDYQLDDVYHSRYECSTFQYAARTVQEAVDRGRGRSEGWAWTDGEYGLMIAKYNPDAIEYSMLDTESASNDVYLTFGGAAPSLYNEPSEARMIKPGAEMIFGKTRYSFYEGLWRRGAYMFRDYMESLGHALPDDYNPPVNWNVLYDVGWHHNDRDQLRLHYNLETMEEEARKAREIGCEALYLDPGWEACEGGTTWDAERLGEAGEFVKKMNDEYGLKVAFRTIGRSYCDDYPGMYRKRQDGATGFYAPYHGKPFYEPCICSSRFQEEKLQRIARIADAGVDFIAFDQFDWRGPCCDPSHGHPVPTTPDMHARAVAELVRRVHERRPNTLIEMHDPIWSWGVRYMPLYYLHGQEGAFDEAWAFEFMWNPLEDLLSGKALSLFYYNLAYSIPLYLHIDMSHDNDNCLAFWWYASTCRHLGIGGKRNSEQRFGAYKQAMAEYLSLKDLYTRGSFYGPDELTHIHVLPEEGRCVLNAFNTTDQPVSRTVEVRLNDLGLLENVTVVGAPHEIIGGKLVLKLELPPFSPLVVKMTSE